jgi:chloramphenicol O-acetyltransferase type A
MKHPIDLANWNRREHFEFFSRFEEPFFGLVANVDCTPALAEAKRLGVPFFLYYLYHAVQAVNKVENLRYRIEDGQVYRYDCIHASATIGRPDHTFSFSFIEQHDELGDFVRGAQAEIAAVQARPAPEPGHGPRRCYSLFGPAVGALHGPHPRPQLCAPRQRP